MSKAVGEAAGVLHAQHASGDAFHWAYWRVFVRLRLTRKECRLDVKVIACDAARVARAREYPRDIY